MTTIFAILHFLLPLLLSIFLHDSVGTLPDHLLWHNLTTGKKVKAHFKYLHQSGCCQDRVECREMDNTKNNYGDRIFRSVDASAAFQDPDDETKFVHALLFRQNIAVHRKISDETLQPELAGLSSTDDMIEEPIFQDDPRRNDFLLMYSPAAKDCKLDDVRAWMHYQKRHIFVCTGEEGNRVIIRKTLNWLNKPRKKIENQEECEESSNGEKSGGHPAMCEKNLIDLLAIPEDDKNTNVTVVAYTEEDGGMDVKGNRMINVKVWYNNRKTEGSEKYQGRLASIYWYRLDPGVAHGIYFTTDAFVCKFEYERGTGRFDVDRYIFESGKKHQQCRPMGVYLECPQAWCYEIGMTTSFTIEGTDGYFYVYFTKSLYHWRIKTRKIPMSVPRIEDALYYGSASQNISAEGEKYKELDDVVPYAPVLVFDATAAFRIQFKDMNYTFSYHPINKWTSVPDKNYYNGSRGYPVRKSNEKLQLFVDSSPEAAHFDNNEWKLYLFQGSNYTVYGILPGISNIADEHSWVKQDGPNSVAHLGFQEGDQIQEVITLGENRNFVLNATHFYYSVGHIRNSRKELRFSFTELFRIQSECYYNDFREYKKTLYLYGILVPEQTIFDRKYEELQLISTATGSYKWETTTIYLIIGTGVLVAFVGSVAIFTYGNKQEQTKTKVIKIYCAPYLPARKRTLSKLSAQQKK